MPSLRPHVITFFWKWDLNLPNMCFRLSIWQNGHRESQKYEFAKWIPRTNEANGLIALSPNSARKLTWFASRCSVGPEKAWTNSPKLVLSVLLVNDSEYSKSTGTKPILSRGCIYLVSPGERRGRRSELVLSSTPLRAARPHLRLALISRFFLRNFGPFSRKKIFAKFSEILTKF